MNFSNFRNTKSKNMLDRTGIFGEKILFDDIGTRRPTGRTLSFDLSPNNPLFNKESQQNVSELQYSGTGQSGVEDSKISDSKQTEPGNEEQKAPEKDSQDKTHRENLNTDLGADSLMRNLVGPEADREPENGRDSLIRKLVGPEPGHRTGDQLKSNQPDRGLGLKPIMQSEEEAGNIFGEPDKEPENVGNGEEQDEYDVNSPFFGRKSPHFGRFEVGPGLKDEFLKEGGEGTPVDNGRENSLMRLLKKPKKSGPSEDQEDQTGPVEEVGTEGKHNETGKGSQSGNEEDKEDIPSKQSNVEPIDENENENSKDKNPEIAPKDQNSGSEEEKEKPSDQEPESEKEPRKNAGSIQEPQERRSENDSQDKKIPEEETEHKPANDKDLNKPVSGTDPNKKLENKARSPDRDKKTADHKRSSKQPTPTLIEGIPQQVPAGVISNSKEKLYGSGTPNNKPKKAGSPTSKKNKPKKDSFNFKPGTFLII